MNESQMTKGVQDYTSLLHYDAPKASLILVVYITIVSVTLVKFTDAI
jgi:hypothetical protein